jgi:hypothetical protein
MTRVTIEFDIDEASKRGECTATAETVGAPASKWKR